MAFFFTMPNSTRMPSIEKMFNDWLSIRLDSRAKGTVIGSDSRMVIGWSQLSNCAARIRYMKTIDRAKAIRKELAALPCSRERPVKPKEKPAGILRSAAVRLRASIAVCDEKPG